MIASLVGSGCAGRQTPPKFVFDDDAHYRSVIEQTNYLESGGPSHAALAGTEAPRTILNTGPQDFRDITLEEAIRLSLTHSKVIRDLGGALLQAPATVHTLYNPALVETDPRFGVDNALSAFDATVASSAVFGTDKQALNNAFLGGGTRILDSQTATFQKQVSKTSVDGTQFSLSHNTNYVLNNAPANAFPNAWNTFIDAEFSHPILRAGGVDYNRIAGVNGSPGLFNGVLLARVNTDIALAEFETAVPTLVSDVENAYWDLYFAYRNLDAKLAARDAALETWRRVHALFESGRRGGEADRESQAREQYFAFEVEVQNALTGLQVGGTQVNNGSTGGTFRGVGGVYTAERRLRLLMGLPITDCQVLRPCDEPQLTRIVFAWDQILPEALARRPELRKQRLLIKRREMELTACRNFVLPTLNVTGGYHFQGFGNQLFGDGTGGRFQNAYTSLFQDDLQGWNSGIQFSAPLGYRRGHMLVRNAELQLSRERAVLLEQERDVVHNLSNAVADLDRAYVVAQTTLKRRLAAREHVAVVQAEFEADKAPLDSLLYAQLRLADADANHYRALVEYTLAVKNVHYEKNSVLDYNQVFLTETPWYWNSPRRTTLGERMLDRFSYVIERPERKVSMRPAPIQTPVAVETEVMPTEFEIDPAPVPVPPPAPVPLESDEPPAPVPPKV